MVLTGMPSVLRVTLPAPSQPARYCARICSVAPLSVLRTVAVTPESSCVKVSSPQPKRTSTCPDPSSSTPFSTGSSCTCEMRMLGSAAIVPSFFSRRMRRISCTLG